MRKLFVLLVSAGTLLCGAGYSQTAGVSLEGIRAGGMGGAGVAVGEGYEGVFYNPAGLTKMNSGCLLIPSFYAKVNQDAITLVGAMMNPPESITDLSGLAGLNGAVKGVLVAGMVKPKWAVNVYGVDSLTSSSVYDSGSGRVDFGVNSANRADLGLIFSIAGKIPKLIPFVDLSAGANVKYVYRTERQYIVGNSAVADTSGLNYFETNAMVVLDPQHGWGIDAGVICKVLGMVDVGVMFRDIVSKVGASNVPMNMTLGVSTKLLGFITVAADFANITDITSGGDLLDKMKVGAEFNLFNFLKLRAGMSNKYPTLGAGISLFFFKFDYAYMGEKPGMPSANPIGTHAINGALIF